MFSQAAVVEQLQERIRQLQAAPRRYLSVLRTGIPSLDAFLPQGGFALGQAVELWGEPASGRTTLALRAVASAHKEARLCAYVDGPQAFYPPAAAALGVDLKRLLWTRPRPRQLVWTTLQLLRSGTFAGVVLDLTGTGVTLDWAQGKRLVDAAARGGTVLWVLTPHDAPGEGMTRFQTQATVRGVTLEVARGRQGRQGERLFLPWEVLSVARSGLALKRPVWDGTGGIRAVEPRPAVIKASEERNGPIGIIGQRPGRDTAMPGLRSILGCEARSAEPRKAEGG